MTTLAPPPRTPSLRNQQIHAAVKIRGCRQIDVAAEFKITQSRVSRIVTQVEAWRAKAPAAKDELKIGERRRHERWLASQRYQELYQRSLQELAASERTLTIERSGARDGKEFNDTTRREQATSVQWLKTALRAAENLLRFAELEPLPAPPTANDIAEVQFDEVADWIIRQRIDAERVGDVPRSDNPDKLVRQTLDDLLRRKDEPQQRPPRRRSQAPQDQAHSSSPHYAHDPDATAAEVQPTCHIRHTPALDMPASSPTSDRAASAVTSSVSATSLVRPRPAPPPSSAESAAKKLPDMTPALTPATTTRCESREHQHDQPTPSVQTIRIRMPFITHP